MCYYYKQLARASSCTSFIFITISSCWHAHHWFHHHHIIIILLCIMSRRTGCSTVPYYYVWSLQRFLLLQQNSVWEEGVVLYKHTYYLAVSNNKSNWKKSRLKSSHGTDFIVLYQTCFLGKQVNWEEIRNLHSHLAKRSITTNLLLSYINVKLTQETVYEKLCIPQSFSFPFHGMLIPPTTPERVKDCKLRKVYICMQPVFYSHLHEDDNEPFYSAYWLSCWDACPLMLLPQCSMMMTAIDWYYLRHGLTGRCCKQGKYKRMRHMIISQQLCEWISVIVCAEPGGK